MKRENLLLPLALLGLLATAFVADVLLTTSHLPARLATHFAADGHANGWMTRAGHVQFTIGLGLGMPLSILGVVAIISRLGGAGLNIPQRAYWLAPERRAQTLAIVQRQMVWLACILVVFFAMIHHLILRANTHTPAGLNGPELWLPIAVFLAAIGVWTVCFVRPFFRTP